MEHNRRLGDRRRFTGLRMKLDLDLLSDPSAIEAVVARVQEECRLIWKDDAKISLNVPVALSEALSNAMLRGNAGDRDRHVHVAVFVSDKGDLVVDVSDEGPGFELRRATDPTSPEHILDEGGRGIFLMHALADEVSQPDNQTVRLVISGTLRWLSPLLPALS